MSKKIQKSRKSTAKIRSKNTSKSPTEPRNANSSKSPTKSSNVNSPDLSILVPVYNVAPFLPLCLESILNQSYQNITIYCINDGSTDDSLQILKKYQKQDSRIQIIDKSNSGYGASLNFALKNFVKTPYFGIVEPDDFIHRDMYKTLMVNAKKHNVDIAKCSFMNFYAKDWQTRPEQVFYDLRVREEKSGVITTSRITKSGAVVKPVETKTIFLINPTIWSAVYKTELFTKRAVKFLETPGASYQDTGFAFKSFAAADTVFCIDEPFYYYRRDNESSSVRGLSPQKIMAVKVEYDSVDEYLKEVGKYIEFGEYAAACRFRSYNWNLCRLPFSKALKFTNVIRKDYRKIKRSGIFSASFFTKNKQARGYEFKFCTRLPLAYLILHPFFRLTNFTIRLAAKVVNHIR